MSKDLQEMATVPQQQLSILKRMGVQINHSVLPQNKTEYDLIIDGIIGYSIKGNPIGMSKEMIHWANEQPTKTLSLDCPSGLDLTSGKVNSPTINADATLTLAMPKKGLFAKAAKEKTGQHYLGDISVPNELYSEPTLNLKVKNLFRYSDILKII